MNAQVRFTQHEADGQHFVQQHTGLIDGRSLLWTRDAIGDGRMTFEEAKAAIEKLNKEKFGGFDDWRLPTVEELFLLADRTRYEPAIDPEYFPNCPNAAFWTSTVDASSPSVYAWYVNFYDGLSDWSSQSNEFFVRAVRASQ